MGCRSYYSVWIGQPFLGPHNSQRQSRYDGCGLGPILSLCVCGGLIHTSATGRGREHSREGGKEGRDTNQTSHFPRSAHKYLCGWFINSGAREEIKVNCNAYIKLGLFHDTARHTMLIPIKDKAIYHETYWQEYWMATQTLKAWSSPSCESSSYSATLQGSQTLVKGHQYVL